MNGMQRLAQAEIDNLELHKALAEAIKRLVLARGILSGLLYDPLGFPDLQTKDLMEILNRTSNPEPVERLADAIDRHGPEYA